MTSASTNRGAWTWIPIVPLNRPSRFVPEAEKDEGYHAATARYYLGRQNTTASWIDWFRGNYTTNSAYAIDNRFAEEAVERMFLGDGASQTSRIPFKQPIISPMLTRMVGGVDNIAINASAELVTSYFADTRREAEMNKRLAMSAAARSSKTVADAFEPMGIHPSEQKTREVGDLSFTDKVKKGENALMKMLAVRHDLTGQKRQVATYMALSGLAAAHFYVNGQELEMEMCLPDEVGFDSSCIKPDMTDAEAVWTCPLMSVSTMAERWPDKEKLVMGVEKWANWALANNVSGGYWPQARPRVYTVYWKDGKKVQRGFIIKDGEVEYCTINEIDPDTGKVEYTDKDLIDPPPEYGKYYQVWTAKEKKEKKQTKWMEVVRYCSFIPWEYMPGAYTEGQKFSTQMRDTPKTSEVGVIGDIVFDYGECDLQEPDPDDVNSVKFPLKFSAWRYIGGHVVSPISAAIDPQQWMNQITSDLAWRMRKAKGQWSAIEKSAIAGSPQTEEEIEMARKEGDTVILDGSAYGGINNAVKQIDEGPGAGFYNLMSQLPVMKAIAESSTGVYEANYGAPGGPNQLVGTLQLQLQQAGVMQQPFYAAILELYKQIYQFEAQGGKQFYTRRPWLLSRMVGDGENMQALIESRDMQIEQFRVTVEMELDNKQLRTITDQQVVPMLMQMGMLDPVTAAQLLGRATPDNAYEAARGYTMQAQAAQAEQAQQMQRQQLMDGMAQEEANIAAEKQDLSNIETKERIDMAKLKGKAMQPQLQALSKHLEPQEGGGQLAMPL